MRLGLLVAACCVLAGCDRSSEAVRVADVWCEPVAGTTHTYMINLTVENLSRRAIPIVVVQAQVPSAEEQELMRAMVMFRGVPPSGVADGQGMIVFPRTLQAEDVEVTVMLVQ